MPTEYQINSTFKWESIPPYLVGGQKLQSNSTGQSIGFADTGGAASIGRMMTDAVDRSAHTPESLAVFLSRHVHTGRKAHSRSSNWLGRFYNKITGEHPYYIKLSGIHLVQTLNINDQAANDLEIPTDASCAIRLDAAAKLLQSLRIQIARKDK